MLSDIDLLDAASLPEGALKTCPILHDGPPVLLTRQQGQGMLSRRIARTTDPRSKRENCAWQLICPWHHACFWVVKGQLRAAGECVPVLGSEIGAMFQSLHEEKGVGFETQA